MLPVLSCVIPLAWALYLFRGGVSGAFFSLFIPSFVISALGCTLFLVPWHIPRMYPVLFIAFSFGIFSGWGIHVHQQLSSSYSGIDPGRVAVFEGFLIDDGCESGDGSIRYRLQLRKVKDRNGCSADAAGEVIIFSDDEKVREWGAALSISSALMSGGEGKNFGFISRSGIGQLEQIGWKNSFYKYRALLRSSLVFRIRRMGGKSIPLLEALLLGVRDDLNLFEKEMFRRSGAMHILALSGMHLGILTGMLYLLLGLFFNRTISSVVTVSMVLFYVFLAGLKPSLVRAAVMAGLVWIGLWTGRKNLGLSILLTAFVILCILMPDSWRTLSFQLSFLALGGIILFGSSIARRIGPFFPPWVSLPLGSSLGAQIMTSGILLRWFHVLYPVGILSALVLTPCVTLFIWAGILYLLLADIPFLGPYLSRFADMLYHVIVTTASWFAQTPGIGLGNVKLLWLYFAFLALILIAVYIPKVRSL